MALPYIRIRLGGTLPGGEVWTVNPAFNFGNTSTALTIEQLQEWADNVGSQMGAVIPGRLRNLLSSAARITALRVEQYGADGKLARYAVAAPFTALTGDQAMRLPTTTAMVATLRTRAAGRSYRGRLYWPALGALLDTATGRFDAGAASGHAADVGAMLAAMEDRAPQGIAPVSCVWSKTLGIGTSVTSIDVGDVPDSQRRRKDTLVEARYSVPYPPA